MKYDITHSELSMPLQREPGLTYVNEDISQRHLCNRFLHASSLLRDSFDVYAYHYADSSNNAKVVLHVLIKTFAPDKSLGTFDRRCKILVCLF